jgi:hypothetical protein
MAVSMNPDPTDVLAWFEGDVDGKALFVNMKSLRSDPNWRVQFIPSPNLWDINLVYWPTGARYTARLEPVHGSGKALWRRTL